ncbi:uncharacterized protein SOCEGT47_058040 [Sorangium cellulosum]|uniref:Beta-lactamase-related domain-containing protein n=1 Tax=Sorangium cellulosum TaxID=56 RepID=A0A4P2Q730_SORCE|nr:serine hydrolase domain-containing protein [Sorangium cellulosum]AUX25260.1 uncharacterized protein SOCEGT47_058040 [Sorangium cellulosum]
MPLPAVVSSGGEGGSGSAGVGSAGVGQAASGGPVGELLRTRILEPAELTPTYLDGAEAALPGLVHGHGRIQGRPVDTTSAVDPPAAGTAGALVSTAGDLTRFYRKVLDGTLLGAATLEEMTTQVDAPLGAVSGYGLGLSRRESRLGSQLGHDGGIWGVHVLVLLRD